MSPRLAPPLVALAALAAAAVASLLGAGCASGRAYYEPARTVATIDDSAARDPASGPASPTVTRDFIPEAKARAGLRLALQARSFDDEPVPGLKVPTFHVRLWVHNVGGGARLELRSAGFAIVDDEGRRIPLSESRKDGRPTTIVLVEGLPWDVACDFVFRAPDGYDPLRPRSFRLLWGFRLDEVEYRHDTELRRAGDRPFRNPFVPVS